MVECTWWRGGWDLWWVGVADRGGEGQGLGGTHIGTHSPHLYAPGLSPLTKGMKEREAGKWVTDICFHACAFTIKWDGPLADWYWSCRELHWRVGPSTRLCPNLRICSSSCLHNEVKWSEEMLGWPWPKHRTPDVSSTALAWATARACSRPRSVKL